MFPNVRLLIAAVVASVVALSCGFGLFAAFRVNHEPLVRLPSGNAPLRLAADNAAMLSVAAGEPFDHRFQIGEPPPGGDTTALAYSAVEPAEPPVTKAIVQGPEDHARGASISAAGGARAPTSRQDVAVSEAAQTAQRKAEPDVAAQMPGEPAPAPTSSVAAVEPPAEPAAPAVRVTPETALAPASAPSEVAPAMAEPTPQVAAKRTARTRVAVRRHRGHRLSITAVISQQNLMSLQPHFLTAPPEQQAWSRVRRVTISRTPAQTKGSAVGGPFVGVMGQ